VSTTVVGDAPTTRAAAASSNDCAHCSNTSAPGLVHRGRLVEVDHGRQGERRQPMAEQCNRGVRRDERLGRAIDTDEHRGSPDELAVLFEVARLGPRPRAQGDPEPFGSETMSGLERRSLWHRTRR
jgi:hypothetical protein